MTAEYQIWCHNPLTVVRQMLANPDFNHEFNYCAYREFVDDERHFSNIMSGNWVWAQSVSHFVHSANGSKTDIVLGSHRARSLDSWSHVHPTYTWQ